MKPNDFIFSNAPEPHRLRTKQILKNHPQIRNLIGKNVMTIYAILFLVGIQVAGAVALNKNAQAQNIFMQAFNVGGPLGLMAYGRQNELEADHLGLIFMAMAGYNPQESVPFWTRMANTGGSKPPELLSTHPSDERRIAQLQKLMPEAMKYYRAK